MVPELHLKGEEAGDGRGQVHNARDHPNHKQDLGACAKRQPRCASFSEGTAKTGGCPFGSLSKKRGLLQKGTLWSYQSEVS